MLLFVAVVGYVAYKSKGCYLSDSNMNGAIMGATLISTMPLLALGLGMMDFLSY